MKETLTRQQKNNLQIFEYWLISADINRMQAFSCKIAFWKPSDFSTLLQLKLMQIAYAYYVIKTDN